MQQVLGNLGGDIRCIAEEQENKIPDSQKDVRRRAKIGAQNRRNSKLRIEYIVLPREIEYPYFLADP